MFKVLIRHLLVSHCRLCHGRQRSDNIYTFQYMDRPCCCILNSKDAAKCTDMSTSVIASKKIKQAALVFCEVRRSVYVKLRDQRSFSYSLVGTLQKIVTLLF